MEKATGNRNTVAGRWVEKGLSLEDLCEALNCGPFVASHFGSMFAPHPTADTPDMWADDVAYFWRKYALKPDRIRLVAHVISH